MSINNWPKEDRPREKLLKNGEHTLSDSELLAIILGTGTKGQSALDLARKILRFFNGFRGIGKAKFRDLERLAGLGQAKSSQIKAALEIGMRFSEEKIKDDLFKVDSSEDVAGILMSRMQDMKKEIFKIMLLNSQNRVIKIIDAEEGSVNQAKPIIREVYCRALEESASFIICVHNHPSGDSMPSPDDKKFTQALVVAGEALLIKCLDHIIIGNGSYFSFCDEGIIK
jgi:DNA repair protein RadC